MNSNTTSINTNSIDLLSFIAQYKRELDEFKEWWEYMNNISQDTFPSDLAVADWEEQFIMWRNLYE